MDATRRARIPGRGRRGGGGTCWDRGCSGEKTGELSGRWSPDTEGMMLKHACISVSDALATLHTEYLIHSVACLEKAMAPFPCLESPMDRGAWWAAVHGVVESRTWLSDFTFTFHFHALEKEMATHSSILAWRIPGTEEPGGLPSMGSHRVGHNWSDLAAAAAAAAAAWPV